MSPIAGGIGGVSPRQRDAVRIGVARAGVARARAKLVELERAELDRLETDVVLVDVRRGLQDARGRLRALEVKLDRIEQALAREAR